MSIKDEFKPEDMDHLDVRKYASKFSESELWEKIRKNIAKIGVKVIYQALLLFYVALLLFYVAQSPNS